MSLFNLKLLTLACLSLLLPKLLWSYELVVIQSVSNSQKTFVTRQGIKDGITEGKEVTFTSNNVALIARAKTVTREYTHWEVQNPEMLMPFKTAQVVTMHDAKEYLWALSPESLRKKYIKEEVFTPRYSLEGHFSLFRGLSSSVSEATTQTSDERGGMVFAGMLEREMTYDFSWAIGARYSQETINISDASLNVTQGFLTSEVRYYFPMMRKFYNARLGLGLGIGYGLSQTKAPGVTSSGRAAILPMSKMLLKVPIDRRQAFLVETSLENINAIEEFEDGQKQESNSVNLRYGVAYKRYF